MDREEIMQRKCRRCAYSWIHGPIVQCDYLNILGHSRGCSIEACQLYKDHPRMDGDSKSKPYTVRRKRKVRKDSQEVKDLMAAIMGKRE